MKHILIPLMIFSLLANILSASLEIGSDAPQITAIDHKGNPINLGAALNKGTSVVFFYPKAMTPRGTKQACSLRDAWEVLRQSSEQSIRQEPLEPPSLHLQKW